MKMQNKYETKFIASEDGSSLGYRQYGQGPGLILVQCAMGSAENFSHLAEELSDIFTVYVPDRRGRGVSPLPYHEDHSIHKVAAFEPPLFVDGLPADLLARFEKEMRRGNVAAALTAAGKAVQLRPIPKFLPDWLLTLFNQRILANQDKQPKGDYLALRELVVVLQYDFRVVTEIHGELERFRAVQAEVLLLGGGKSPAYLKNDLDALEKVLPHVKRITFPELDHSSSWNYDEKRNPSGNPEAVARQLRKFFT